MRYIYILLIAVCLFSCTKKKNDNNEDNKEMKELLQKYCIDSLDIQNLIGSENYMLSYKIKNGKLLIQGGRNKERTSVNYTSLIFIIDIERKELIATIEDPVKDYIGLIFDLFDDDTLLFTHMLTRDEIYLVNIHTLEMVKKHLQFDKSANRSGRIDINGNQMFMTQSVYGFTVVDLNTLKGKSMVTIVLGNGHSTMSYPIDTELNLLSGTFKPESGFKRIVTLYAINDKGNTKWEKALPPIKYGDFDDFNFYNYNNNFIVKYHNTIESWDKTDGSLIWSFTNEHPIDEAYMTGNRLIIKSSHYKDTGVIPANTEEQKRMEKENTRERYCIIDLETGNLIWDKRTSGIYSEFAIINEVFLLLNEEEKMTVNIVDGKIQNIGENLSLDKIWYEHIMDTGTGKLYLDYQGTLYW